MNILNALGADSSLWLIGLAFGLAVLLIVTALASLLAKRDQSLQRRLRQLSGQSEAPREAGKTLKVQLKRVLFRLLNNLAKPAKPRQNWQENDLRAKLLQAGFHSPTAVNTFLGVKVAMLIAAPILLLISPLPDRLGNLQMILALVGSATLGFFTPQLILERRISSRRKAITRELPDVLDLLVISVEAGLGLDQAIRRVSQEVKLSCPVLGGEFTLLSLELRAGIPRQMALKNLARRCGVEGVGGLVTMLIQADRFGVSVGRSLRVHSDSVRTQRRQQMEEAAAKIPLKLLFPVLFMIFPAIMVVMAGPAVIRVSQNLMH
ncbi:MAG: type II secretion system F family protein [Desulfarculaceae bacterium]|nr:type II secretion system F family protein [Desulfarculaceae bacterium]MCF8047330.1 type II secretion system F family protein [Desulfarculaceae bacterium]MCF8063879.1 type II secretion system F family protein [Desulfarculaceae bacterium]MCF8096557.1 type II secretion system F family protein [Desulfarculaceae bacterium]MCF8122113.1 type II secretion system F family protein [Desulfarculaceae bacterium]